MKVLFFLGVGGGGGITPPYGLYSYVRPQRVWFFSRFGHKYGTVFVLQPSYGYDFKKKLRFHHYRKENQQNPFQPSLVEALHNLYLQ